MFEQKEIAKVSYEPKSILRFLLLNSMGYRYNLYFKNYFLLTEEMKEQAWSTRRIQVVLSFHEVFGHSLEGCLMKAETYKTEKARILKEFPKEVKQRIQSEYLFCPEDVLDQDLYEGFELQRQNLFRNAPKSTKKAKTNQTKRSKMSEKPVKKEPSQMNTSYAQENSNSVCINGLSFIQKREHIEIDISDKYNK